MVKIKLKLFESVVGAILLPNIGLLFTTLLLIISLIVKQEPIVYKGILISYIVCLSLMIFTLVICFLVNKKSIKEFVLKDSEIEFLNHKYQIDQVSSCEYYICKWYALPIALIYKQQAAGLIIFKFNSGEKIQFKIFYKDYLKLKNKFKNIIVK